MKIVRTLILVALGALGLLGLAASSASAGAKVCSTSEGTHSPKTACLSGHGFVYSGKFLTKGETGWTVTTAGGGDILTVTANTEIEGEINGTTGTGRITKLLMIKAASASCPSGVTATTNASAVSPYHVTATTDEIFENTNGRLDITTPVGYAAPTFKLDCNVFGIHTICTWKTSTATLTIDGSDTAPRLTATNVSLARVEGPESTCGSNLDWIANEQFSTPSSLFIE
jgi:hypothetical protein